MRFLILAFAVVMLSRASQDAQPKVIVLDQPHGLAQIIPSRGQLVATDVAAILEGIAQAPGGQKAVMEIMKADR